MRVSSARGGGKGWRAWCSLAVVTAASLGCMRDARVDEQIARIGQAILEAEASGALRCAPRELAVARAQLQFAELERSQGFSSKTQEHLEIAERHAKAAQLLSPPEHCRPPAPERPDGPVSAAAAERGRLAAHEDLPHSRGAWTKDRKDED